MKILYIITKSNFGGAQKYVYEKSIADKSKGDDVLVAVNKAGQLTDLLNSVGIPFSEIRGLQRDFSIFKEFVVINSIISTLKKFNPNIVHLNSSKIGGLGSLSVRIYNLFKNKSEKAKIIYTAHGWAFNEKRFWGVRFIIKFLSYITILLSDEVIVLSQSEYDQVSRWPFAKNKLKIQPLKIQEINFLSKEMSLEKISSIAEKDINKNNFIIGTVAELHKNKGLNFGIEAINEIKISNPEIFEKITWLIIGDGEEEAEISNLIKQNDLTESIILTGYIDNAAKYLKAFDICLLPSTKEGLPYALLEAESAGLPIIATDVGGIKEVFDKKPNIIIEHSNITALKDSILKMFNEIKKTP